MSTRHTHFGHLMNARKVLLLAVVLFTGALCWLSSSSVAIAEEVIAAADDAPVQSGTNILGRVQRGTKLIVLETKSPWLKVQIPGSDQTGWIHSKYVQTEGAVTFNIRLTGPVTAQRASQLLTEANKLLQSGYVTQAMGKAVEAYEIFRQVHGENHEETMRALGYVGGVYAGIGEYDKAAPIYKRMMDFARGHYGLEHKLTSMMISNYAALQLDRGDPEEALPYAQEALKLRKATLGIENRDTQNALRLYSRTLLGLQRYDEARQAMQEVLDVVAQTQGRESQDYSNLLGDMGRIYFTEADYPSALKYYQQALSTARRAYGEEHEVTATDYQNVGALYHHMGNYVESRKHHEISAGIRQKVLGAEDPQTSNSYYNLGLLDEELGDLGSAKTYYELAYEIRRKAYGEKNLDTTKALAGLSRVVSDQGDFDEALQLSERVLQARLNTYGENHPQTASALEGLSELLSKSGDYAKAIEYAQRALTIRRKVHPPKHPETASCQVTLSKALFDGRNYDEALRHARESLEVYNNLDSDHPYTANGHQYVALYLAAQEKWHESASEIETAQRLNRTYEARVLPTLSEHEQLHYLVPVEQSLKANLWLGVKQRQDAQMRELSAGWLINRKAVGLEATASLNRLNHPEARKLLGQLRNVRNEVAQLSALSVPESQRQSLAEKLNEVKFREAKLAREAGNLASAARYGQRLWVEVQEVKRALPAKSVFIDISHVREYRYTGRTTEESWGPQYFVAWVLTADDKKPVDVVILGERGKIETAIQQAREALQLAPTQVAEQGEAEAERQVQSKLQQLAKLILAPLEPHLKEAEQVVLSPDGQLWLVPWAALPLSSGEYLVEKHPLQFVNSGRDLVELEKVELANTPGVIFADPAYDSTTAITAPAAVNQGQTRAIQERFSFGQALRLPATATEARAIKPSLESLLRQPADVKLGEEATEAAFQQIAHPRVLVLSTHGFFLKDQWSDNPFDPTDLPESQSSEVHEYQSPLLRCGLLLAGCNQHATTASGSDGIVTGLEIVGADLRGTELVVLSACETGVGAARNGEGVSGLRQAFQLAGAQSVAATLWQIPDVETARLMSSFFANLAAGDHKAAALQKAQVQLIEARRKRYGAAHPYFWAAFTLTGKN